MKKLLKLLAFKSDTRQVGVKIHPQKYEFIRFIREEAQDGSRQKNPELSYRVFFSSGSFTAIMI